MELSDAREYRREVRRLYKSAFPADERAPLRLLFRRVRRDCCFYAVTDEGRFIGLAYVILHRRLAYVFYLAVEARERGRGYGTAILTRLKEIYGDYIVILNIEDPHDESAGNIALRRRRLGFYERNGFVDTGIKTDEAGVVYELLSLDMSVTIEEYLAMMEHFMGKIMFRFIFRGTLKLRQ